MGQIKNIKLHIVTDIKVQTQHNMERTTCVPYFLTSTPTSIGEDTLIQLYGHLVDEYNFIRGEVASTSTPTSSSDVQNVSDFLVNDNEEDENDDVDVDVDVDELLSVED